MSAHQLLIFPSQVSPAVARRSDPVTSHMAASAVNVGLSQMLVLSVLKKIGEGTDEQIYEAITLFGNAISPSGSRTRRKELVAAGLIKDSGRVGVTKSGRKTIIWEAVRD